MAQGRGGRVPGGEGRRRVACPPLGAGPAPRRAFPFPRRSETCPKVGISLRGAWAGAFSITTSVTRTHGAGHCSSDPNSSKSPSRAPGALGRGGVRGHLHGSPPAGGGGSGTGQPSSVAAWL